ncbi:MAG: outer membrane lipoprotein chaperone LolA [Pseudomonadota bacterium]|nr:outer membrane lipoprotein chaperone LolA [Pseudomonadota bacterium]
MKPHVASPLRRVLCVAGLAFAFAGAAHADTVDTLKDFVRDVKTGSAAFTQTVTQPDGKKKSSSGTFEFARPNRFRFTYVKPFEQLIVSDGKTVWIYDADLNQVTARKFSSALGATPAALLAGGTLDRDFDLAALPAADGLDWVQATPKARDSAFQSMRVGFRGKELAAVEITDSFGQRSLLRFMQFVANSALPAATFQFVAPAGADVIEQ